MNPGTLGAAAKWRYTSAAIQTAHPLQNRSKRKQQIGKRRFSPRRNLACACASIFFRPPSLASAPSRCEKIASGLAGRMHEFDSFCRLASASGVATRALWVAFGGRLARYLHSARNQQHYRSHQTMLAVFCTALHVRPNGAVVTLCANCEYSCGIIVPA